MSHIEAPPELASSRQPDADSEAATSVRVFIRLEFTILLGPKATVRLGNVALNLDWGIAAHHPSAKRKCCTTRVSQCSEEGLALSHWVVICDKLSISCHCFKNMITRIRVGNGVAKSIYGTRQHSGDLAGWCRLAFGKGRRGIGAPVVNVESNVDDIADVIVQDRKREGSRVLAVENYRPWEEEIWGRASAENNRG
tara:strand:- start:13039 stop:13626 length:588 start_codon:yes stop_codon:yes gene_type:complete